MDPKDAFKKLTEGNNRFVNEELLHPRRDKEMRESLVEGQSPVAIVLSCADSRVSPEILFDQGIGDLFIIRVAGNVLGTMGLESIKYALLALNTPLVVVLGHENCGAVNAVVTDHTNVIPDIAKQIEKHCTTEDLEQCIKQNVLGVVEDIKKDPEINELLESSKIAVVGGYYELTTGRVSFLNSL